MTEGLKKFIQDNKDLINQNTKESWEEIYSRLAGDDRGNFTEIMLSAEIDPSRILEYIPRQYLQNSKIQQYKILDNVTSIGKRAFYDCDSLTSVVIGDSVKFIEDSAFSACISLTSVHISSIEAWCKISFGGSSANPLYYAKNLYLNNELVTELEIPNTVTEIKYAAFYHYISLTGVAIPNSVTSIGNYAFENCRSLTSITFNGTVEQWNQISKSSGWNYNVPAMKVVCSDGEVFL